MTSDIKQCAKNLWANPKGLESNPHQLVKNPSEDTYNCPQGIITFPRRREIPRALINNYPKEYLNFLGCPPTILLERTLEGRGARQQSPSRGCSQGRVPANNDRREIVSRARCSPTPLQGIVRGARCPQTIPLGEFLEGPGARQLSPRGLPESARGAPTIPRGLFPRLGGIVKIPWGLFSRMGGIVKAPTLIVKAHKLIVNDPELIVFTNGGDC